MHIALFAIILMPILSAGPAAAQETWIKSYEIGEDLQVGEMIRLRNGNFSLVGSAFHADRISRDLVLLTIDENGIIVRQLVYGDSCGYAGTDVVEAADGTQYICGYSHHPDSAGTDVFLMSVDSAGTVSAVRSFGADKSEAAVSLCPAGPDSFILLTDKKTPGERDKRLNLHRMAPDLGTDIIMELHSTASIGYAADLGGVTIEPLPGGRYILSAYDEFRCDYGILTRFDHLVIFNSEFDTLQNHFSYSGYEVHTDIITAAGGGFFTLSKFDGDVIGLATQGSILAKFSDPGDSLWVRRYKVSEYPDYGYAAAEGSDGNLFIAGQNLYAFGTPEDAEYVLPEHGFLLGLDPAGNYRWYRTYLPERFSRFSELLALGDGGLLAAGVVRDSTESDASELFLVKTDADGVVAHVGGAGPIAADMYVLLENYPNPFNPETTIQFSVPEPGQVRLEAYSVLGRKVRTLLDREYAPGLYEAVWDGTNDAGIHLGSGIYLVRMTASNFSKTIRVNLIKENR